MSGKASEVELTSAQEKAINTTGGGITVSAAAGSGKTWVLVQRVIRLLTGENAVPADRLLILTFTNLAAGEMRSRISRAIDELISEDPDNDFYRQQQLLLASADICTIDSFCSKVVRDNFFRLGVSRDYRIGTASELYELRRKIMSGLIEKYYIPPKKDSDNYEMMKERYDSFNILSMLITSDKLDTDLEYELLEIYNKYTSHAFPEQWMDECVRQYNPSLMIEESKVGIFIIGHLASTVKLLRNVYDKALTYRGILIKTMEEKKPKKKSKDADKKNSYENTMDVYDSYGSFLDKIEKLFSGGKPDFDKITEIVCGFEKITVKYGSSKDRTLITAVKTLKRFADIVEEKMFPYAVFDSEIFIQNNEQLYPVMKCLRDILKEFDNSFFEAKKERGILDFHDLESLVLKLLYDYDESAGKYVRSNFSKEMAEKYHEIMIDEYQDTNDIQENIFKALSRNDENLFVVGDIKQSIYRFREAKPLLFKDRCSIGNLYSDEEEEAVFPALIVLDKNFRSRKGIIESVNYIFNLLMSEMSGEIEYDKTQSLTTGAAYDEPDKATTEIHIVEYKKSSTTDEEDNDDSDPNEEDAGKTRKEAIYCAGLIRSMIDNGEEVYDSKRKQKRKAIYSDFCIMTRTAKNRANIYAEELEKVGIPSYADAEFDLLERYEVKAAISYLKILSNPLSDVDMAAALMCPVFGFTPDELVLIKSVRGKSYYKKLLYLSRKESLKIYGAFSEKVQKFVNMMRQLRQLAVTMPTDGVLQEFFERTGYMSVMNAMSGGEFRVQNLRRLINFVAEYEQGTSGGLTGFVRRVKYLEETQNGIKVSDSAPLNAVKIMTIHHSKGLEFPICILASTNSKGASDNQRICYHSELGIGLRTIDTEKLLRFDTFQFAAVKQAALLDEKREELRVLYVALTRAKEKLIILSTVENKQDDSTNSKYESSKNKKKQDRLHGREGYLNRVASMIDFDESNGKINGESVLSCKTLSDMIIMCALLNSDMDEMRREAYVVADSDSIEKKYDIVLPKLSCSTKWKYVRIDGVQILKEDKPQEKFEEPDEKTLSNMGKIFERNKNDVTTLIPSKVSASTLAHQKAGQYIIAVSSPKFDDVSPTEKGTATHAFLQNVDFGKLYDEISVKGSFEKEKERIISEKRMTEKEFDMISDEDIKAFTRSKIFDKMLKAAAIYREYQFTVKIPAELAFAGSEDFAGKDLSEAETVLQGAIDCIIEEEDGLTIVDYKTDRNTDPEKLTKSYGLQLSLYKEAAKKIFGKKVKDCVIYSLTLNEEVYL